MQLRTPGVYVQEVATLPPSVAEVSTAVPAFIGYTERRDFGASRITSFLEFQARYGTAPRTRFTARLGTVEGQPETPTLTLTRDDAARPNLFYALSHYFANGGGPCWIVPIGGGDTPKADFLAGIDRLEQEDEPTLILFPEAAQLLLGTANTDADLADYSELAQRALAQCNKLKDRFVVLDVPGGRVADFRNTVGIQNLSYGAAYHPYLTTTINWLVDDASVQVIVEGTGGARLDLPNAGDGITVTFSGPAGSRPRVRVVMGDAAADPTFELQAGATLRIGDANGATGAEIVTAWTAWTAINSPGGFNIQANGTGAATLSASGTTGAPMVSGAGDPRPLSELKSTRTAEYNLIKDALTRQRVILPPSAAVVGAYASVDRDRGVWKAPANVSLAGVIGPVTRMTDTEQEGLNVDSTAGKSINAIRDFTGRGTMIWGARTLAGNDNEWRYVPVRRLFITIEESTKKASAFAVFEPNDATTWLKVKGMIESYLYSLWERGALAGSKPDSAYFVNVGLGKTMTAQDVLEGRLIVEIGVAAVRPAEFVVLRFMHRLQQA